MEAATSATACRPDEHCLLTVLRGTVSGWSKRVNKIFSTDIKIFDHEITGKLCPSLNKLDSRCQRKIKGANAEGFSQNYTRETSIKRCHPALNCSFWTRSQNSSNNNVPYFPWIHICFFYHCLQSSLTIGQLKRWRWTILNYHNCISTKTYILIQTLIKRKDPKTLVYINWSFPKLPENTSFS